MATHPHLQSYLQFDIKLDGTSYQNWAIFVKLLYSLDLLGHIEDLVSSNEMKTLTRLLRIVMLEALLLSPLLLVSIQRYILCLQHKRCGIIYEVVSDSPVIHRLMLHPKLWLQLIRASTKSSSFTICTKCA